MRNLLTIRVGIRLAGVEPEDVITMKASWILKNNLSNTTFPHANADKIRLT